MHKVMYGGITVALFLITKFWKQCKYILTAGWSNNREQYVHTMEG